MQTSYDSFIFMSQTLLLYATFEVKFNVLHQNLEDIDLKILEKHFQRTIQADLNLFFFFIRAYLNSYYTKVKHGVFYSASSEDSQTPFISIFGEEDYPAQDPE